MVRVLDILTVPCGLDNPTIAQLLSAINGIRRWIEDNQDDPEYTSFQLNFCFSGHADFDEHGRPGIVLADSVLGAYELAFLLCLSVPEEEISPGHCRVDLFLDCCFAGAVARAIAFNLRRNQSQWDDYRRSYLSIGQIYCACLDDEEAFELDTLPYSAFTFAFLNECSRKQPSGYEEVNIGLRDVGWYTEGLQHPLLLDFTAPDGVNVKFPTSYYFNNWPLPEVTKPSIERTIDRHRMVFDPVGAFMDFARVQREECVKVEQEFI